MSSQHPASDEEPRRPRTNVHWHVVLTHFPISAFFGAFAFMAVHLITRVQCYERAAQVSLLFGAFVMVPTTWSGWTAWKRHYKGFKNKLFLTKIRISFGMLGLSVAASVYQVVYPFRVLDLTHYSAHVTYFVAVLLLLAGAVAEGYWGARLHHK